MTLIEEKKANPGKGRRGADPGKQLGEHPQKGGMIVAKNGRYGPYVSHDGVNANLPGDKTPETITLDEAAALIDARAERSGGRPSARRARPPRGAKRDQEGRAAEGQGCRSQDLCDKARRRENRRGEAEEARRRQRRQGAAQIEEGRGGGSKPPLPRYTGVCWQTASGAPTLERPTCAEGARPYDIQAIHWYEIHPNTFPFPARTKSLPSSTNTPARSAPAKSPAPSTSRTTAASS